jgi:hypothetical protein
MEEADNRTIFWIDASDVWSFIAIAMDASKSKILGNGCATILAATM